MKKIRPTQQYWLILFGLINGCFLYQFLLPLPYGFATLFKSFMNWRALSPHLEIAILSSIAATIGILVLVKRISENRKNQFLYWQKRHAHPAYAAFFNLRNPGFSRAPLYKAYPQIQDSAYSPDVQFQVWHDLYRKHAEKLLVSSTRYTWLLLRDLYFVSLLFLIVFLIAWLINKHTPLSIAIPYLFVFGAQSLFLLFSARRTGVRFVDNVLAAEIGIDGKKSGNASQKT